MGVDLKVNRFLICLMVASLCFLSPHFDLGLKMMTMADQRTVSGQDDHLSRKSFNGPVILIGQVHHFLRWREKLIYSHI